MAELTGKRKLPVLFGLSLLSGKEGDTMYARVVNLKIKPGRRDDVVRLFQDVVIPGAKNQKGFKGGLLLTGADSDKAVSVSLWETKADITASEDNGYYRSWVSALSDVLTLSPVREIYEVSNLVNLSLNRTEGSESSVLEEAECEKVSCC